MGPFAIIRALLRSVQRRGMRGLIDAQRVQDLRPPLGLAAIGPDFMRGIADVHSLSADGEGLVLDFVRHHTP